MPGSNSLVESRRVDAGGTHGPTDCATMAEGIYFSIEGQEFVARDKRYWRRTIGKHGRSDFELIIGQIAIANREYVILTVEKNDRNRDPRPTDVMTRREVQVALLIADGKCDKEIARQLAISIYTVREHIRRIFAKLNVCRRTAIISQMLRH